MVYYINKTKKHLSDDWYVTPCRVPRPEAAPAREAAAGMREHLPTNHPGRAHMLSMLADALVNQVKESDNDDVLAGGGGGVRRGAEGAGARVVSPGVALSEVRVPRRAAHLLPHFSKRKENEKHPELKFIEVELSATQPMNQPTSRLRFFSFFFL